MPVKVHNLGRVDYLPTYEAMQAFTAARNLEHSSNNPLQPNDSGDQLWICEHPPVYTQGLAGKSDHVLNPGDIPVVQTNRGGQVTFHGPGQVVAYPLIDLKRAGYYVKEYVYRIEESVIRTLLYFGVTGHRVTGSPGYVWPATYGTNPQRPMFNSDDNVGAMSQGALQLVLGDAESNPGARTLSARAKNGRIDGREQAAFVGEFLILGAGPDEKYGPALLTEIIDPKNPCDDVTNYSR